MSEQKQRGKAKYYVEPFFQLYLEYLRHEKHVSLSAITDSGYVAFKKSLIEEMPALFKILERTDDKLRLGDEFMYCKPF